MTAVPALPSAFVVGKARASDMELLRLALSFSLNPPIAELRQTVAQTLTTGVTTAITFTTEDVDSVNGHDTVTNPDRYTAVYAGWYQVSGGCSFAASAVGQRIVVPTVNGTLVNGSGADVQSTAALTCFIPIRTKLIYLNVGDFVQLTAFQNSGGNLNTDVTTYQQPNISVRWVSN